MPLPLDEVRRRLRVEPVAPYEPLRPDQARARHEGRLRAHLAIS